MRFRNIVLIISTCLFFNCSSLDKNVDKADVIYNSSEDYTLVQNFTDLIKVNIKGNWEKTTYVEEFNSKKKNYFLYLKEENSILGLYFEKNTTSKTNKTENEYFLATLSNEFDGFDSVNLNYEKTNSDKKSYQIYTYKDYNGINFCGLIGLKNKVIYHLTLQNESLNDLEKEKKLIDLFLTMKP